MDALSLEGEAEMRERLLALYWELQAYEEVPEMLAKLKEQGSSPQSCQMDHPIC